MEKRTPPYLPALTGLRAIAAWMVFFHHFNPLANSDAPQLLIKIINEGYIGVTLFFVLSGFIIAYHYLLTPRFCYREYLWKRFSRIYPLYFLLTVGTYLVIWIYYGKLTSSQWMELVFNLSLLKGFFADYIFTGIPQAWTLTVEALFYLLAPIMAGYLFKKPGRNAPILAALFIMFGVLLMLGGQAVLPFRFLPDWKFIFQFTFFGRIAEFILGMLVAWLFVRFPHLSGRHTTVFGSFFIALSVLFLSGLAEGGGTGDEHWLGIFTNNLLLPVFGIGPLFWGLLHEHTWLKRLLSTPFFQLLGNSSYAFYLIHLGIFRNYLALHLHGFWLLFISLQLASVLLYWALETPIKYWLRAKFSHKTH